MWTQSHPVNTLIGPSRRCGINAYVGIKDFLISALSPQRGRYTLSSLSRQLQQREDGHRKLLASGGLSTIVVRLEEGIKT